MICQKCVLTDKFPRISFDENGVCNFCRSSKKADDQTDLKKKYEEKFKALISEYKGKGTYDCLVAFSGGKDSTYTLHLLKNNYHLNILSFSFDNWFQSKRAAQNIRNVVQHLNLDHITILPSFDTFKKILHTAISSHDLYSAKSLERASAICTTCLSLIRFIGFKIAVEKNIPFLIFGLSPGQAPIATSVFKTNAGMIKNMQKLTFKILHSKIGDSIKPYFLEDKHFEKSDSFPISINPLAFSEYNEEVILSIANNMGWIKPDDTDPNSTNCLLNAFANQVHIEKFGYNPYAIEIAELVRIGYMSREDGIKRLEEPPSQDQVAMIKKILTIT